MRAAWRRAAIGALTSAMARADELDQALCDVRSSLDSAGHDGAFAWAAVDEAADLSKALLVAVERARDVVARRRQP